jgi:hypothetical protein
MSIWALSDPHLSLGIEGKSMDVFGEEWKDHSAKIFDACNAVIKSHDLLLIPGDISWAMRIPDAIPDLEFIDKLPGTKIISKGNHDYWWPSNKKLSEILPKSILFANHDVIEWNGLSITGVRLWDTPEFSNNAIINFKPNPKENTSKIKDASKDEAIFEKELVRLESSLKLLNQNAYKILLCHYPPLSYSLSDSRASQIIEKYRVNLCVFGHLHNVKKGLTIFGEKNGVNYVLTSGDYLDFKPIYLGKISELTL